MADEEEVHGGYVESGVIVYVREAEEVFSLCDLQPGLFHDLTLHAFLGCLAHVGETARKVERALCRLLLSRQHEKLVLVVKDDSRRRGAWIEIILKAAILTLLALFVVVDKMLAATNRAVLELF